MSKIAISGPAGGTATYTVTAPTGATDRVATLPDNTGTLLSTGSTAVISQAMLASNVVGNGPAFSAFAGSGQALTGSTFTKLIFNTEEFDTASAFDSTTNYRFQPSVSGYYQFNAAFATGSAIAAGIFLYKNGSSFKTGNYNNSNVIVITVSALIFMNGSTDYVEAYGVIGANSTLGSGATNTYFQASMVRAA